MKRTGLLVGGSRAGQQIETEYFPNIPFPRMQSVADPLEHLTAEQARTAKFPIDNYQITRFAMSCGDVHFGIIDGMSIDECIDALWKAYADVKFWQNSAPVFCGECGAGYAAPPGTLGTRDSIECPYCELARLKREVVIAGAESQQETQQ